MGKRTASFASTTLCLAVAAASLSTASLGCDEPSSKERPASPAPSASAVARAVASAAPPVHPTAEPPPPAPSAPAFSADDRAHLLEDVAKEVEERYFDVKVGAAMAAAVRKKTAAGGYAEGDEAALARAVTADLLAESHDKRATLDFDTGRGNADAERRAAAKSGDNRTKGGFGVGGPLPPDLYRVAITSFEPVDEVRSVVAEQMTQAAGADGLLLDLSENTGGDLATAALVASYLFDGPRVHLGDTWWRSTGSTEASWTVTDLDGKRFGGKKPVVVLVTAKTSGAAEELAYDLQALHRAVVVGEKTAGIARPVAVQKLAAGFVLKVPTGRVTNAVTKKDWEGVGVVPDVAAAGAECLKVGYVKALRLVMAAPGTPESTRRGLKTVLQGMGAN
jgi:hypothetical protein